MKSIVVGITGASGSVYGQRLLARLNASPEVSRIDLVISQAGVRVVSEELGLNVAGTDRRVVRELLGEDSEKLIVHSANDIGASIANGVSRDLVHRAADVVLKESRPLLLVPRETPLNVIHLENMLKLARLGVRILPAMPGFYHHPKTIDDLVEHFIHRLLDHLGVSHEQLTRWEGSEKSGRAGERGSERKVE